MNAFVSLDLAWQGAIAFAVLVAVLALLALIDWLAGRAWRPVRRAVEERRRLARLRGRG